MRVLVTGGAGFIGSTLVDQLLAEGHTVDAIDNLSTGSCDNLSAASAGHRTFMFQRIDLRETELTSFIIARRPDVIFHLAAQVSVTASITAPLLDAEINILGSLRVFEAARTAGVKKIVFAASGGTLYGNGTLADLPFTEQHPHDPSSPYGIAKRTTLDYLTAYRSLYGLDFTALTLANVYGPRQDPYGEAGVVAIFADNIVAGRESTIFGDGEQTRDFVYVDDVVRAFSAAASGGSGLVINIGSGSAVSVNELIRVMSAVNGSGGPSVRHLAARNGDVLHSALSPGLALKTLGWQPTTSLEDGVRAVLEFARARLSEATAQ